MANRRKARFTAHVTFRTRYAPMIEAVAQRLHCPRSEVIRRIIDAALDRRRRQERDADLVAPARDYYASRQTTTATSSHLVH